MKVYWDVHYKEWSRLGEPGTLIESRGPYTVISWTARREEVLVYDDKGQVFYFPIAEARVVIDG